MPKEQPTNSESEINESVERVDEIKAPDSVEKSDLNPTATAKTDSPPTPPQPDPSSSEADSPSSKGVKESAEVKEPAPTPSQSAEKKRRTARPAAKQRPKPSENAEDSSEIGTSKIEAVFVQVWSLASKVVGPILSAVGSALAGSKFYGNLQNQLKPLQPVAKSFSWTRKQIWNKVVKPLWGFGLKFLRGRFTDTLKPFSDRFLTIILLGIFAIIYWLYASIATAIQPAVQQPVSAPVVTAPAPKTTPSVQPVPQPAVPQPESPVAELPVVEPPPEPEPEQTQIIDVQSQVAQVFDRYSQDLIQSIQANFQAGKLVIKVSDRWFELPQSEQNQLGTDVLERSRKLDFPKLEIRDQTDQLLAREPVVGSNIIVLQRRTAPSELMPDSPA